jgi:hypothetical protein
LELKLEITDMSEAEAKDRYMRGLKAHVFRKVRMENPKTLNETVRMAQQFDEAVFNCRQAFGGPPRDPNAMEIDMMSEDDQDYSSVEESENEDDALDDTLDNTLHAMKNRSRSSKRSPKKVFKNKSQDSKMNYNEKVRCMQGRLCFKCKKPGHRIRDCPQWKNLKAKAQ